MTLIHALNSKSCANAEKKVFQWHKGKKSQFALYNKRIKNYKVKHDSLNGIRKPSYGNSSNN